MNEQDVEALAFPLMDEQSLIEEGWTLTFNSAKKRAGVCRFASKEISLSRYFIAYASREDVEQVLLHEIAHAILPAETGHSHPWKVMAGALGYKGHRLVRNPYLEAHMRAGVIHEEPVASSTPLTPHDVRIGSVLSYQGHRLTVYAKGRKRWHATSPGNPRKLMVSFNSAHLYLVPEEDR
jgi:hypothetical protein